MNDLVSSESATREKERPFLSAQWLDLAILNYCVSPDLLRPFVPTGTELDEWRGNLYVSVVGFRFVSTRVLGISIPGHRNFEEVNLRFYVRRAAPDGWRRGVVFIRELVPRRAIAWVARAMYNEPYRALPMRHDLSRGPGESVRLKYEWNQDGRWDGLSLVTAGPSTRIMPGSEQEFITEHFWGYTRQRNGTTVEYNVRHPAWCVADAKSAELRANVASLYGQQFVTALSGMPASAFLADGSDVVVDRPRVME